MTGGQQPFSDLSLGGEGYHRRISTLGLSAFVGQRLCYCVAVRLGGLVERAGGETQGLID